MVRAHRGEDHLEGVGEAAPVGVGHSFDHLEKLLLRDRRRLLHGGAAAARQAQHEPPSVIFGADARDEACFDESRHDDGNRALIGSRSLRELREGKRFLLSQLGQHEKLCRGQAHLRLRRPIRQAQQAHEPPHRIENALAIRHGRTTILHGNPNFTPAFNKGTVPAYHPCDMLLVRLTAGLGFTLIGVVGLVLPILPGWIFFPVAAVLFFPHSRFTRRTMQFVDARTPGLATLLRRVGVGEPRDTMRGE